MNFCVFASGIILLSLKKILLPHSRLIIFLLFFLLTEEFPIPAYVREGLYGATVKDFSWKKLL